MICNSVLSFKHILDKSIILMYVSCSFLSNYVNLRSNGNGFVLMFQKIPNNNTFLSTYLIGQVMLRQQRIKDVPCSEKLPYVHSSCISNRVAMDTEEFVRLPGSVYTRGDVGNFMFGQLGVYDGSGYVLPLNTSRY